MAMKSMLAVALEKAGLKRDEVSDPVIDAVDPMGNRVTCSKSWWEHHVEEGHAEMAGLIQETHTAISKPSQINASPHDPDGVCYYLDAPHPYGGKIIQVAVHLTPAKKRGFVKTAQVLPRGIPSKEQCIWPTQGNTP